MIEDTWVHFAALAPDGGTRKIAMRSSAICAIQHGALGTEENSVIYGVNSMFATDQGSANDLALGLTCKRALH